MSYTMIPRRVLISNNLSAGAKVLYMLLLDYLNDKRYCYPTIETLAENLNCSSSKVKREIKELREIGLIKIYRRPPTFNNVYVLVPTEWVENLEKAEIEVVGEDEQYFGDKEELDGYIGKVMKYYEEQVNVNEPKSKSKKEKIEKMWEKVSKDEKLNSNDMTYLFMDLIEEIRGEKYRPYWKTEPKILKEMLIDNGIKGKQAEHLMRVYIEKYDENFKRGEYNSPRIRYLGVDFIFAKVLKLASIDKERENIDTEMTDFEF